MSTILEALRKLQQDGQLERKHTEEQTPSRTSESDRTSESEASESKTDEADPSFRPITDSTALDAFVNASAETSSRREEPREVEAVGEPRSESSPPVAGLGGDWRDRQPESFRNAAVEPAEPAETAEDHLGEGLALAESRLLTGVADSESGVAYDPGDDDEPSIYDDPRADEGEGADNQRRTLLIASTALILGLVLGFFLVRMKFQGDTVVAQGDTAQQAAVDASSKQGDAVTPRKQATADKKSANRQAKAEKKAPAPTPAAKPAKAANNASAATVTAKQVPKAAVAPRPVAVQPKVVPPGKAVSPNTLSPTSHAAASPAPPVAPGATPVLQAKAAEPEVSLIVPVGAPHVDLVFIQWARNPTNRLVSIRNLKGTLLVLREGDYADPVQGMKVAHIGREWVDFLWKTNLFRVPVNDF